MGNKGHTSWFDKSSWWISKHVAASGLLMCLLQSPWIWFPSASIPGQGSVWETDITFSCVGFDIRGCMSARISRKAARTIVKLHSSLQNDADKRGWPSFFLGWRTQNQLGFRDSLVSLCVFFLKVWRLRFRKNHQKITDDAGCRAFQTKGRLGGCSQGKATVRCLSMFDLDSNSKTAEKTGVI